MAPSLPSRLRRRSLNRTLRLLLLLILIPVLAVQIGIYWSWYRTQKQREIEANLEMARAVAGTFEGYVNDLLRQERAIGLALTALRPMTTPQVTSYLRAVVDKYPAVRNLAWISPQGTVLAATEGKVVGVDARQRPYVAQILAGRDWVLTDLRPSSITGKPTITVTQACRNQAGALLGIVTAHLEPERFGEILKVERADGGTLLVIDRSGKVVYRPRSPMAWNQRDWAKRTPVVQAALAGREAASIARSGFDGRKRIVAAVPVPSLGWIVGASREESAVLGPIWRGVARDSLLFLLVASAAMGIATLTARRLSGHLGRLRDQASRFGSGGLEAEVAAGGPEEFVQLADSFNRVARELRAREIERDRLADAERQALAHATAAYERTHRVLESIREPFFSFDAEWRFTYINREAERLWRRRREEMLGRPVFDFFPEELEPAFYDHFREAFRTGLPVSFEARSGTSGRWVEARAYPFEGGLWVYFRDIEHRKRTQEELEALIRRVETEHATLEAVLQQMPLGVVIVEAPSGRVLHASAETERTLTRRAADGSRSWDRQPPGLHADGRAYEWEERPLVRSMTTGEVVCCEEITFASPDGGPPRILSISSAPIRDADGRIFAGVGISQDTTAQVSAAHALRESEERFRAVFENAPISVAVLDRSGRIVAANRAAHHFLGFTEEELLGKTASELLHGEDVALSLAGLRRLVSGKSDRTRVRERRYRRKDGGWLWGRTVASAVRDSEGSFQFAIHMVENVTENKRLQEQLFQAQKMESLGYLAAGVAHDFNNLLAVVAGNAELGLLALPTDSRAARHLVQIEAAARRASELTDKMLDYAGESPSALEKVDLSRVIGEMGEVIDTVVPGRIAFRRELAAELPAVEADPAQLRRVVLSLLTNASEAVGAEEPGEIRLRTGTVVLGPDSTPEGYRGHQPGEGAYVFLEVSDTGCGMDEATKEKIYDPFFSTKFTGRGLGLAAVLGIVRSHGGAIRVESAPGKGATFRVLLPLPNAEGEQIALPLLESPVASEPKAPGTVLVVDDEEQVREIVRSVLEEIGYVVVEAADGAEGVARFRERSQEVATVLLDMTMPRMGGPEAFREIHRLRPDVPVIVASGYPQQDTAAQFGDQQPTAFIQKPFRLKDLEEVVRSVTGTR